ncbi:uncharacterized protein LOC132698673 [Cylas formicarius]|uniref:uncharacterized protein LOC132698673 n=1 Tax=Cylas formicarius TaxID=197179 RepID=UPI002958404C|nr:uncharacterized protein LOC132698673 [Cylas formicarius]
MKIVLILGLISTVAPQFLITPVNNTVGIFYHEESSLRTSNNKWTLLVYKELEPLREAIRHNNKILSSLTEMLDDSSPRMTAFKTSIQTHFSLLTRIADSVEEKFSEITIDTENFNFRTKRGLINGVGTIFKSITGNLDSTDGEYFNECIDKVTKDEHEIEKLLKNQISVTSSVIKSFNSTIQSLRIDEETFNQDLTQIQKSLYDISDTVAFYESQIKTLNLCESLMESYVYLESYLSDILNAITFARIKVLHSSIIYPRDLVISLQEISKSLTKNNLPLPPYTSSIARYVDIMELEAFQTENKVVFVLRIPLIDVPPSSRLAFQCSKKHAGRSVYFKEITSVFSGEYPIFKPFPFNRKAKILSFMKQNGGVAANMSHHTEKVGYSLFRFLSESKSVFEGFFI